MIEILKIAAGALVSVFFVIWAESKRRPVLEISIEEPLEVSYPELPPRPAKRVRHLRVNVENKALRKPWRWLTRNAALHCTTSITFHHIDDGQNVFGRTMLGRWAASPQPAPLMGKVGDQDLILWDHDRINLASSIDIHPGTQTQLDIAARFDTETKAFGWSNDSYFSDPLWRPPQWQLEPKRYLVRVHVSTSGAECTQQFRLVNDVSINDFRLEPAQPNDRAI